MDSVQDDLHALGLLTLVALVILTCMRSWKGAPPLRLVALALGAAVVCLLGLSLLPGHLCDRGGGVAPAVAGAAGAAAHFFCLPNSGALFSVLLLASAGGLAWHTAPNGRVGRRGSGGL